MDVLLEYDKNINEIISLLNETGIPDEPSQTFVWDVVKEKSKNLTDKITTKERAIILLKKLFRKLKHLSRKNKVKLSKYILTGLLGVLTISSINNILTEEVPELKDDIMKELSLNNLNVDFKEKGLVKFDTKKEKKEDSDFFIVPNRVSDNLIEFLKKAEGYRSVGYIVKSNKGGDDGMITIGHGHAEPKRKSKYKVGQRISGKEAEKLLRQDLKDAEKAVNDIFEKWDKEGIPYQIDQNMYDAMVSIAFNRGRGNLWNSEFVALIKQGKYAEAQEEIKNMSKHKYAEFPGLKTRRDGEAEMFGKNLNKTMAALEKIKNKENNLISESYKNRLKLLAGIN